MERGKRRFDPKTDLAIFKAVKKQFGGMKRNSAFLRKVLSKNVEKQLARRVHKKIRRRR